MQQFDNYKHYSEAAARAERAADCAQALQYWQKAQDHAPNRTQREWCQCRVQFLNQWRTRIEKEHARRQAAGEL